MKKSRSVVLLITGSVVLASCKQKAANPYDMAATPTPTATPASGNSYWYSFWRSWHIHSLFGNHSFFSGISRGGFGSHGKASVAT